MRKKYINIKGVDFLNTNESIYDVFEFYGNKLIIRFNNVQIIDDNKIVNVQNGDYIKKCFIILEDIFAITLDYDKSRTFNKKNTECFGGISNADNNYYEFWIQFNKGYTIIDNQLEHSNYSWSNSEVINEINKNEIMSNELINDLINNKV